MSELFSAEHFVEWCKSMIGQPYWYGTTVAKCTEDLLTRKTKQYPDHYTSTRTSRYKSDIANGKTCADCIGAYKGYCWTNGYTEKSSYQSHGCPDRSANGMFSYAKEKGMDWGAISTLPEIPGIALTFDGHVGYYIGNGYAIEWRGFAYGCVMTKVSSRKWEHWYKLPCINYGTTAKQEDDSSDSGTETCPYSEPTKNIKRGMTGDDVKWVQWNLVRLGYSVGSCGIDGDFGQATDSAVRLFQNNNELDVDGIVGKLTRAKLKL